MTASLPAGAGVIKVGTFAPSTYPMRVIVGGKLVKTFQFTTQ